MVSILQALDAIDPSTLSYSDWIHVGMGLKEASSDYPEITWKTFDDWSFKDPKRYIEGDCEKRWNSFQSEGITRNTVFSLAYMSGFKLNLDYAYDFDTDYIESDSVKDSGLMRYLKTLFEPDDTVSYVMRSKYDEKKDKYQPIGNGSFRKAKDLIADLEKYNGSVEDTFGTYNPKAGAWIRFNPMDGEGTTNNNVEKFKYALVEADDIEIDEQYQKIINLKLPCSAIVHSGKRSLHAIVRIDAKNYEEYRDRVRWLYKTLEEHDFPVDPSNKNPSRMSRLPGIVRGKSIQHLVEVNTGFKSFIAFKEYIETGNENLELPSPVNFLDLIKENKPLAPELIKDVLRQGHKLLISGPSKAGKSFALIELAVAIAEGKKWISFKCQQGRVLYINLEIDEASFRKRMTDVYEAFGIDPEKANGRNITIWNLRGKAAPLEKLIGPIIKEIQKQEYIAVIIDPIYKVQGGDENAAGDIAKFTNQFDRITTETGAAVIYCHHHSKGAQGQKRSMDRASGSGVFARDADGLIDFIEIDDPALHNMDKYDNCSFWRVEGTLREFKPFQPFNIFFKYPRHLVDTEGVLDNAEIADGNTKNPKKKRKITEADKFEESFNKNKVKGENYAYESDICNDFNVSEFEKIRHKMKSANSHYEKKVYSQHSGRVYRDSDYLNYKLVE